MKTLTPLVPKSGKFSLTIFENPIKSNFNAVKLIKIGHILK